LTFLSLLQIHHSEYCNEEENALRRPVNSYGSNGRGQRWRVPAICGPKATAIRRMLQKGDKMAIPTKFFSLRNKL
jgi:hypothetical protein